MLATYLLLCDFTLTSCPLRHLPKIDTNLVNTKGTGETGAMAVDGIRPTRSGLSDNRSMKRTFDEQSSVIIDKSVLPNNTLTNQLEWLHVGPVWLNLRLGLARVLATLVMVPPLAKLAPSLAKRWPSSWLG